MSIENLSSSFSSPDSETIANSLVLVGHGILGCLDRLKEMNISKFTPFSVLHFASERACTREYACFSPHLILYLLLSDLPSPPPTLRSL